MKRIISLLLAALLIFSAMPGALAAGELTWPPKPSASMNYKPAPNSLLHNNPPNFAWPLVSDTATYDLKVCLDKELENIAFEKSDIKFNVYNFSVPFETGVKYYWSVRYKEAGRYSVWTEPSEFIISEDAYEYALPEFTRENIDKIIKKEHPRIIFDSESIKELRNYDRNKKSYQSLKQHVDSAMQEPLYTMEQLEAMFDAEGYSGLGTNGSYYTYNATLLANAAMLYLINGEEKYFNFIVETLTDMKDWDPVKVFDWSSMMDVTEGIFVQPIAFVYDWLYNELPENVRKNTKALIERHMTRYYEEHANNGILGGSTVYNRPYGSHQWRLRNTCIAAIAIYDGESEIAYKHLEFLLPIFANHVPFAGEDGGFSNGVFYWEAAGPLNSDLADTMLSAGFPDVKAQAYYRNTPYYLLYCWPVGGVMSFFGDHNNQISTTANLYDVMIQDIINTKTFDSRLRGINAWMMKKNGRDKDDYYHDFSILTFPRSLNEDVEYITPTILPNSRAFLDTGVVSLFSSLADDNKTALFFRSSQAGTNGHAHPDQNSFVIHALGEYLAIDSGYYNESGGFGSSFDLGYNRKTYAHNSITIDVGEGQPHNDATAKGKIVNYLHHSDFDLVSGDATSAYKGALGKFNRDIIYIRPGSYVVIDDLKAKEGSESEFEWWLNSYSDVSLYESERGVQLKKNEAALDVKIAYPEKITAYYTDEFAGPDGKKLEAPAANLEGKDKKIYFKTEKTAQTRIVAHMNVHKVRDGQPYVKETVIGNVLKLEFEDGTIVYVKLDDAESVTVDGYTFKGTALTVKGNSIMVVDETNLSYNGKMLFEADVPVSCAFGDDEISISSLKNEGTAKLYMPGVNNAVLIKDIDHYPVAFGEKKYGVKVEKDEDFINFDMYYGAYQFYLNDKPLPGSKTELNVTLNIDGEITQRKAEGDLTGKQIYAEFLPQGTESKYYTIGKSKGVSGKLTDPGRLISVSEKSPLILNEKDVYLELNTVNTISCAVENNDDNNYYENSLSAYCPAINYSSVIGDPTTRYWQTILNNVPHNDTTLQTINNLNESVVWTLDVPESGYYDIVLSCSTLSGYSASRLFVLGNTAYPVIFKTDIYNDLDSYRLRTNQYLEKGKIDLSMYVNQSSQMIYDWVGLLPSDK